MDFLNLEKQKKQKVNKLDSIDNLKATDFLKMDVQGTQLRIFKSGSKKLKGCLAIQLEVSYFPLYEDQPSFGEIDV